MMLGDKLFTEKIAKKGGFIGTNVKGGFRQNPNKTLVGNKSKPTAGENQRTPQGTDAHQKALAPTSTKTEKIDTNAAPIVSGGNSK